MFQSSIAHLPMHVEYAEEDAAQLCQRYSILALQHRRMVSYVVTWVVLQCHLQCISHAIPNGVSHLKHNCNVECKACGFDSAASSARGGLILETAGVILLGLLHVDRATSSKQPYLTQFGERGAPDFRKIRHKYKHK